MRWLGSRLARPGRAHRSLPQTHAQDAHDGVRGQDDERVGTILHPRVESGVDGGGAHAGVSQVLLREGLRRVSARMSRHAAQGAPLEGAPAPAGTAPPRR